MGETAVNTEKRYTGYSGPKNGWQAAGEIALGVGIFATLIIPGSEFVEAGLAESATGGVTIADESIWKDLDVAPPYFRDP